MTPVRMILAALLVCLGIGCERPVAERIVVTQVESVAKEHAQSAEQPVEQAAEKPPTAGYYFTAKWCPNCPQMGEDVAALIAAGLPLEVIDIDERPDLARHFGIRGVPAIVKFGQPNSTRWVGRMSAEQIASVFDFFAAPQMEAAATPARRATPRVYACGGYGSGTVIDEGLLLTCAHVVIDELTGEYRSPIRIMFGDELVKATVVGHDSEADLALLKFEAEAAVIPVSSSAPAENEWLTTHGYPNGQPTQQERRIALWKARRGANGGVEMASPDYRFASQTFIPGESGGGVTDASGSLVGVISATDGRMGYVVSLEAIQKFLGE